jgi:hypothetical protein
MKQHRLKNTCKQLNILQILHEAACKVFAQFKIFGCNSFTKKSLQSAVLFEHYRYKYRQKHRLKSVKAAALCKILASSSILYKILESSVAEPHHFYAAPGKNFDVARLRLRLLPYSIARQNF